MTTAYEEAVREVEASIVAQRSGLCAIDVNTLRALIAGPPEREGWRDETDVLIVRGFLDDMESSGAFSGERAAAFFKAVRHALLSAAPKP